MKSQILKYAVAIFAQFIFIVTSSCASTYRIYSPENAQFIPNQEAFDSMAQAEVVVLGETHYEKAVQQAEGWALEQLSLRNPSFQMAWEFLNHEDQNELQTSFDEFVANQMSASEWIAKWFPNNSSTHEVYLPMYEVAKKYSQKVMGTNAPRTLKQRLMNGGRTVLDTDAEVWPFLSRVKQAPKQYLERFKEVMGGHADGQTIEKYYLAQFYTDAYMANAISSHVVDGPVMMVVGHFHSDYGHGLPFYLKDLGIKGLVNIRIVDASNLSQQELEQDLQPHPQYGALGDYILVIQ